MKPAREVEGVFALPRHHLFGGDEGAADDGGRRLVHARKDGIVFRSQSAGFQTLRGKGAAGSLFHRFDKALLARAGSSLSAALRGAIN